MKPENKIEPILFLLFGGLVFFTLALFAAEHWFPNDGQLFQVVSGLVTGLAGAFMMRVKPPGKTDTGTPIDNPAVSSTTTVTQETVTAKVT